MCIVSPTSESEVSAIVDDVSDYIVETTESVLIRKLACSNLEEVLATTFRWHNVQICNFDLEAVVGPCVNRPLAVLFMGVTKWIVL